MTTAYTPILKLALPVTGELSGTWGNVVNDNITSMVEQAVAGLATINTWTTNSHTLTSADGTTSESRCAMLVAATGSGGTALSAAGEIICPAATKLYVLQNGAAYAVTLKTASGTGVAVPAGQAAFLFCDGTNVNACVTTIVNGAISGNLTVDGNTTLGNATTDTITATGQFNTDLLPSTDNARDLGSTANSWRTLYCDTSVLAANLSLSGNTLASTNSNGDINITPNGTGKVVLPNLRLSGSSSGYVGFQAAAAAGSTTYTLPSADGTNGQMLSTNGSGTLSWATGGGGTPGGSTTQVQYNNAGAFAGSANFTWDNTNLKLAVGTVVVGRGGGAASYTNKQYNTQVGNDAMSSGSLTSVYSTAIGALALQGLSSGNNNTALGYSAGLSLDTASNNTVIGFSAAATLNAANNTVVGASAYYNGRGTTSVVIGRNAGYGNISGATGNSNVVVGDSSFYGATTAANNVLMGYQAGYSISSGNSNTVVGYNGAAALQTGGNNIVIGNGADTSSASVSNEITLGNGSITKFRIPGLVLSAGAYWINVGAVTVSALPSASTAGAGARAFVTDATATTFASTVAGGGANSVPVYSDGTNWKIG